MKKTPLKRVSKKRAQQLREEAKLKQKLLEKTDEDYETRGCCPICGRWPDFRGLSPHEKVFRSHAGKPSEENTSLACGKCHSRSHGRNEAP